MPGPAHTGSKKPVLPKRSYHLRKQEKEEAERGEVPWPGSHSRSAEEPESTPRSSSPWSANKPSATATGAGLLKSVEQRRRQLWIQPSTS